MSQNQLKKQQEELPDYYKYTLLQNALGYNKENEVSNITTTLPDTGIVFTSSYKVNYHLKQKKE